MIDKDLGKGCGGRILGGRCKRIIGCTSILRRCHCSFRRISRQLLLCGRGVGIDLVCGLHDDLAVSHPLVTRAQLDRGQHDHDLNNAPRDHKAFGLRWLGSSTVSCPASLCQSRKTRCSHDALVYTILIRYHIFGIVLMRRCHEILSNAGPADGETYGQLFRSSARLCVGRLPVASQADFTVSRAASLPSQDGQCAQASLVRQTFCVAFSIFRRDRVYLGRPCESGSRTRGFCWLAAMLTRRQTRLIFGGCFSHNFRKQGNSIHIKKT